MRQCEVRRLHRVTYENGMRMQEALVARRQRNEIPDQLLLLEHPPVITMGRAGKESNLLASRELLAARGVRFYETTRGGDVTFHGPGQIVGYPIVHLGEGRRDIRKYVESVEEVLIRTAADFGVETRRWEINRGIWVGADKLAAIGVRVARWVTSHGFAFNVSTDMSYYQLITPCGLQGVGVTSLGRLLGQAPEIDAVRSAMVRHFAAVFEREMIERPEFLPVVKVLIHDGERVLLLRRQPSVGGNWQPVTGRVEAGESEPAAAVRELREETGLAATVEPLGLVQSFLVDKAYVPDQAEAVFAHEHTFAAKVPPGSNVVIDEEEHEAYAWFTIEAALDAILWSDDRDALELLRGEVLGT
ncbi:MAG: lipoyl(octanoyl) transferase LipB [Thermoanaerobaculia bacterium]